MINDLLYQAIKQHALDEYPNEACGFIVGDAYIRVGNVHPAPHEEFAIADEAWHLYGSKARAFIHSHPDWHPCPSESDMAYQESSALPWGIISTDGKDCTPITWFGDQVTKPPLVGRGFCHGVTDCYDIIRDWYWENKGIRLKNFPRSWEWWLGDKNLYETGFKQAGFDIVPQEVIDREGPKPGDVFLATIGRSKVINHGGIYVGNGLGIHHLTSTLPVDPSRLSKEEPVERWQSYITLWVRYNASSDSPAR